MAEVVWRPQALRDLDAVEAFFDAAAPAFAAGLVAGVVEATRTLGAFPEAGRVVPEIGGPEVRERMHRQYRIVSVRADDRCEILTVFHSARPFGPGGR